MSNIFTYAKESGYVVTRQLRPAIDALNKPPFRVLLQSANAIGKTRLLAHVACYYLEKGNYQIYCVGKTEGHCRISLMREIVIAARKRDALRPYIARSRHKIDINENCYAKILTQEAIESIQGLHGGNVIFLCDEATGIKAPIFDAILSNLTGNNNSIVCAFNPINAAAYIKQLTTNGNYETFIFSALDHPNVERGESVIDGAVTRSSVIEFAERYSERVPSGYPGAVYIPFAERWYKPTSGFVARVLGRWPAQTEGGLYDISTIKRSSFIDPPQPEIIGIDVNRRSIMVSEWTSNSCNRIRDFSGMSLPFLASRICELYPNALVSVDDNGIGCGLTDILLQLGRDVLPVNVTKPPEGFFEGTARPMNLRSDLYLELDRRIRDGALTLPADTLMDEELLAVEILPSKNQRGTVKVKDKAEMMKLLGRSPDRADSVILGLYAVLTRARNNSQLFSFYNHANYTINTKQQSVLGYPGILPTPLPTGTYY